MAGKPIEVMLDRMAEVYTGGAYPGRNSEGLNPEWPCDPFHVLIATILSQRTTDDNTRKASDNLFHKYPTIEAIADADVDDVAELVDNLSRVANVGMTPANAAIVDIMMGK